MSFFEISRYNLALFAINNSHACMVSVALQMAYVLHDLQKLTGCMPFPSVAYL